MTRNYQALLEEPRRWGRTIPVPRWLALALAAAALLVIVLRIYQAPVWTLQRLDSPDGRRSAVLQRTAYVRDHLRVRIKDEGWWFVAYYSPPFTNNFRVDLGERLAWSPDGQQLDLRIQGRTVWSYDFASLRGRDADPNDAW